MSNFGQVELSIEKRTGASIASQTYMPNINIGNVASNNFSSPAQQAFEFDVTEQGEYVIAVYSAASEWSDCIVGQLSLTANNYATTGIRTIDNGQSKMDKGQWTARPEGTLDPSRMDNEDGAWYDLSGRKIVNSKSSNRKLPKGIYIKDGHKVVIK